MVDTQESLYEQLYSLSTIAKQRFVENFSGDSLDTDRWNTVNRVSTNTFAMSDSVDGGFSITTSTASNAEGLINFNGKHHYSPTASVFIGVARRISGATSLQMVGGGNPTADMNTQYSSYRDSTGDSFKSLRSHGGSTASQISTSVSTNTDWTSFKLENTSSNLQLSLSGELEVTKTTDRPTANMQPIMRGWSSGSTSKETSIRYLEVYNT